MYEEFKDIKGVIRICKPKVRQHDDQRKTDKRTNNYLQNTTQKIKNREKRTPQKTGDEFRCSGKLGSSCYTSDTCRVTLVTNPVISHEWGKDQGVFMTSGAYPWSFVTRIFRGRLTRWRPLNLRGDDIILTYNFCEKTLNKI